MLYHMPGVALGNKLARALFPCHRSSVISSQGYMLTAYISLTNSNSHRKPCSSYLLQAEMWFRLAEKDFCCHYPLQIVTSSCSRFFINSDGSPKSPSTGFRHLLQVGSFWPLKNKPHHFQFIIYAWFDVGALVFVLKEIQMQPECCTHSKSQALGLLCLQRCLAWHRASCPRFTTASSTALPLLEHWPVVWKNSV